MSRYYFHVRDGTKFVADPDGGEFSTVEAAVQEAIDAVRDLVADRVQRDMSLTKVVMEVTNPGGKVVQTIPFISVLRLDE